MNYKDLVGKVIHRIKEDESYIAFISDDDIEFRISKFEPYCVCYVGEYIDEITQNGTCFGVITNIETNIEEDDTDKFGYDYVYKGNVTFYFENGKLNMNVHGEDNGFYGVRLTMPVEIIKGKSE